VYARKRKLIKPGLQLRLIAVFFCTAALAVQAEAILISYELARLAERMPTDGSLLLYEVPSFVRTNLLLTFALLVPLILGIGILTTFRIVGPIHRFERFLTDVRDGNATAPCAIRKGDELQDFCRLLNEVTVPLRQGAWTVEKAPAKEQLFENVSPAIPSPRTGMVENAAETPKKERES